MQALSRLAALCFGANTRCGELAGRCAGDPRPATGDPRPATVQHVETCTGCVITIFKGDEAGDCHVRSVFVSVSQHINCLYCGFVCHLPATCHFPVACCGGPCLICSTVYP